MKNKNLVVKIGLGLLVFGLLYFIYNNIELIRLLKLIEEMNEQYRQGINEFAEVDKYWNTQGYIAASKQFNFYIFIGIISSYLAIIKKNIHLNILAASAYLYHMFIIFTLL